MSWRGLMGDMNKKLFGTKVYPDQILRGAPGSS